MNVSCYGSGLSELVNLHPDIDVLDKKSVNEFAAHQWRRLALTLGFDSIEAGLHGALVSGGQLGSVLGVGLKAVDQAAKKLAPETAPASAAQIRYNALSSVGASQRGWRLDVNLGSLPNGGCLDDKRIIPAVNRATYFHPEVSFDVTPRDCVWAPTYPMYVGTWPWMYGHALSHQPSALRWMRSSEFDPIQLAAQYHANSWSVAGNARVDARAVYTQLEYFRTATAAIVEMLPKEPGAPGSLYRSESGLLRVYMKSRPTDEYLYGPLGAISVVAYNHILSSIGAFFRVREEVMKHHKSLPPAVQSTLKNNPDPCIQELLNPPGLNDKIGL